MRTSRLRLLAVALVAAALWAQPLRAQSCNDDNVCTNPDMCSRHADERRHVR
jgi:hypothetical protein